MKKQPVFCAALLVAVCLASCGKKPDLVGGYFPLTKGKVNRLQRLQKPSPGSIVSYDYEIIGLQDVSNKGIGASFHADYQLTVHFDKSDTKEIYHLTVNPYFAVSPDQVGEVDGKRYPEKQKRIFLECPLVGAHGDLRENYPYRGGRMIGRFYFGQAHNSMKLYPDCVVADETWDDHGDHFHTRTYYQRGIGIVRAEDVKADGTVDPEKVEELVEE